MEALEGLGVRHTFRSMEFKLRPGSKILRVNAFHPSFAINYHPHMSCFRQLLILEVAQACGLNRGQWHNQIWMDELRKSCQAKVKETLSSGTVNLKVIQAFARSLSASTRRYSIPTRYRRLVESRISEHFNDACLCVRAIHCKKEAIDSEDLTDSDAEAIGNVPKDTMAFLKRLVSTFLPDSVLA
ncbi:hypothetical protein PSPO01_15457 [Paraphaeosphaeria sporulosa]